MKNSIDGIDIDLLIKNTKSFAPARGKEFSSRDALYFTEPFIEDKNSLAALLLLFDSFFVFRNYSYHISEPLSSGNDDPWKNSVAGLVELLQ